MIMAGITGHYIFFSTREEILYKKSCVNIKQTQKNCESEIHLPII